MPFDVARVRGLFPTLGDGYIHLDGPAGTLIPESVARAVSAAMRVPLSNRRGPFPSSARADALVDAARRAFADLVGGEPAGVVLGPNMTTITYGLARTLAKTWKVGDEIVVSRLDHDANIAAVAGRGQGGRRGGALGRDRHRDLRAAGVAVRRADHPADPAGRGDRGEQRGRHPAGRARDRRPRPTRSARWCTWTACTPPPHVPIDMDDAGRRLLRHQRVQVGRAARVRGGRRAGGAGPAAAGQAGAGAGRGAGPVRDRARPPSS